ASGRGPSNQMLSEVLRAGRASTAGLSPLSTPDSILIRHAMHDMMPVTPGAPYRSPLVSKSSGCGQDLSPPTVYSTRAQFPGGRMALAGARMRTGSSWAMPRPTVCHQGGSAMHKLFVGNIVLVLCVLGWGARGVGEQRVAPRGELRVVDRHDSN